MATPALWTALLGAVMILAGLAFGPTPLLVPGVGLSVLGLLSGGWVGLAARGRLDRRLEAARVVEGEPCAVWLDARTPVGPPPGSELVEPLLGDGERSVVDWRRRKHGLTATARFPRRGLVIPEPARLIVRDPLGLACRELRSPVREVLVLPRVEPVRAVARSRARTSTSATNAPAAPGGAEIEVDSLREAPPEASATRIHWPAFARTGTLIERTLIAESDRRPLVVLDASSPASSEALDSAVRAAASLCVWLARAGGCELLLPGERRPSAIEPTLASWPALHARLAVLEAGGRPSASERLGRGTVFWVTASAAARLPRGLARAGAAERYLVAPGPAPAAAAFEVAGCHGRRLARASA
ncbi:MAG: hypothetical protein AVDCRST_MAG45-1298, partial [uncultured Solirubrobacterales bacterium]